jgi:hypothetical protein
MFRKYQPIITTRETVQSGINPGNVHQVFPDIGGYDAGLPPHPYRRLIAGIHEYEYRSILKMLFFPFPEGNRLH